jgi:hypothetical protein
MGIARLGRSVLLGGALCMHACAGDDTPSPESGGQGGQAGQAGQAGRAGAEDAGGSGGMSGMGGTGGNTPSDAGVSSGSDAAIDAMAGSDAGTLAPCAPRAVSGAPTVHFHHVHFNTVDPEQDLMFFEKFFDAPPVTFCEDAAGSRQTRATRTERGWFLYTQVAEAPDPALNTYLEHVGWVHPMPGDELMRHVELGITLYPEGRFQCPEAASGLMACPVATLLNYYYYVQAPSGARVEVALGPGPAMSGFGHVHFIMGEDLSFFETVSGGAYTSGAIDMVNHINASLTEDLLASETVVDTRGKPIDHIAYSTTDLEAAKARIEAAGIAIAEDISFKDEYGFRSFFVRSPKGTWLELVEDSPFE